MTDEHDEVMRPDHDDGVGIGVGMGGSCPVCRAPVDLGQEFCLECGSPIRFTPRQRRQQRTGDRTPTAAPAPSPRPRGFPWVPFLIVLVLVVGGIAFALVESGGDSRRGSKSDSTDSALPEITNSTPGTSSTTKTIRLQGCDPNSPLDGTEPAESDPNANGFDTNDPNSADGSGSEQIPTLSTDGADTGGTDPFGGSAEGLPSTKTDSGDATDASAATVTVDENGDICASDPGADTDPTDTDPTNTGTDTTSSTPTTPTTPTSTTPAKSSDGWPADKEGWTVVINNYPEKARADDRAGAVQSTGVDAGVLLSSDFTSLCPGYYVVFSGIYTSKTQAERHVQQLKDKDLFGIYAREIRRSGTQISCRETRP